MVDSIVLRVHNLRKHRHLEKVISRDFKSKGQLRSIEVYENEIENCGEALQADAKKMINYFWTEGIGTHRLKYENLKKLNSSGHYYLNAFINKDRDFIEFNFSIPKYLYGTNVFQFVPHNWDKEFAYHSHSSLKFNLTIAYQRLMGFLKYFFSREFPEEPIIDFRDVEVNRIDLCFNQVFNTKRQALEYLAFQKTIRRKHSRDNGNQHQGYDTSYMYYNKRYSLKIYHKGSEYSKSDLKEHRKINARNSHDIFNIENIQHFADRMLRYEITIRKGQLSYLYNLYIFRQRCPTHKALMKTYKAVEKVNNYNLRLSERMARIKTDAAKERYLSRFPYKRLSQDEKKVHRYITRLINKSKDFRLQIDKSVNRFNHVTDRYGYNEPRALFSKKLFGLCADFFVDFINEFQVKEKPAISVVSDLIDQYNFIRPKKLPKNEMLKFFMLLQNKTFEDIKRSGIYSKATFYRYIQRFKEIGITQHNIVPTSMIAVNTDLRGYHEHLMLGLPLIIKPKNKKPLINLKQSS